MPRWPSSLRARLTLWYTLLLALPLIVFAIACYLIFAATLDRRTDRFIGDALTAFASELTAERRSGLSAVEAMRRTVDEVRFRDLQIAILDRDSRVLVATALSDAGARDSIAGPLRGHDLAKPTSLTVPGRRGLSSYRVISHPLAIDEKQFSLTGIYSLGEIEDMLERIRAIFLVAIPLLVLCAATGGYLLARRSLAPVASMAAQAASITASNMERRLSVQGGAELAGLARVVNDLLDRLERAFAQQRRFVADASHELRTPTAILRTEADVTLSREHRPEAEYRTSVTVMRNAGQRLTRIVDELFLLARADSGHLVAQRETIYLEDLVDEAIRAVHGVAELRGVKIELKRLVEAPVRGDADLLGRLLLNLLDNAIKYSPEGRTVQVEMSRGGGHCEITVVDEGPGIPPTAHEQIFERFFRVDPARSRSEGSTTSGAGLGLAIARRIAEMHAGRLELAGSRPGRTEFRLTLPLEATA